MARHVLLVEDNEYSRDATRQLLEFGGVRVSVAGTVVEAVATARGDRPDVVLVDLTLPDGDGLAIVRELRLDGNSPAFAVITGHDQAEVAERCIAAGCSVVLVKPVSFKDLMATIEQLLAKPD